MIRRQRLKPSGMMCVAAGLFMCLTGTAEGETLNPHWTGAHCLECHIEPQGGTLQFGGDTVAVCTRCHAPGLAGQEVHPVNMQPSRQIRAAIPSPWPLPGGRVTCLTCHHAILQMKENAALRFANPAFLRGPLSAPAAAFCFNCHPLQTFQKTNPHIQLDKQGRLIEERCLLCHQSVPDQRAVPSPREPADIPVAPGICLSCHGEKQTAHPARADHLGLLPEVGTGPALQGPDVPGAELPLAGGKIFCGTCHNVHQQGVILRKEAQAGAGEDAFLRLAGGAQLCCACHTDKRAPDSRNAAGPRTRIQPQQEASFVHKPSQDQKCKACHAVTADSTAQPEEVSLCFQEGCHTGAVVGKAFVHDKSVLAHCTLCHSPHRAGYDGLLVADEKRLCLRCHPLIRDAEQKALRVDHKVFEIYSAGVPLPYAQACGFCHSPGHTRLVSESNADLCTDCHLFIMKKISLNSHQTVQERACTACHDPHTSPYRFQLKEPPERYVWGD